MYDCSIISTYITKKICVRDFNLTPNIEKLTFGHVCIRLLLPVSLFVIVIVKGLLRFGINTRQGNYEAEKQTKERRLKNKDKNKTNIFINDL